MIQRKYWHKWKIELFKRHKMAIEFLHCLKVFQWITSKQIVLMFEKVGDARASESSLLNFSRGSFEGIALIQFCRELNDVCFETRLKSSK